MLRIAHRMYPKWWRSRYGSEFDALLEDCNPRWRDLRGIFYEACRLRLEGTTPVRTFARMALIGAVAGIVISFGIGEFLPRRYVSMAVIGVTAANTIHSVNLEASQRVNELAQATFNEPFLLDLMWREHLTGDVKRKIYISGVRKIAGAGPAFEIAFQSGDPATAQRVVQALTAALVANAKASLTVLEPAKLPTTPVSPNIRAIVFLGVLCGALLGVLLAAFIARVRPTPPRLAA